MKPKKQVVSAVPKRRGSLRVVWLVGSLSLIAVAGAVLALGGEALRERTTRWVTSSQYGSVDTAKHRVDTNERVQPGLPRAVRSGRVETDPVAALSEHQRAFIQPTLDALDSRLTSPSSGQAQAAMVAYRQRLIEQASGISNPTKDGE